MEVARKEEEGKRKIYVGRKEEDGRWKMDVGRKEEDGRRKGVVMMERAVASVCGILNEVRFVRGHGSGSHRGGDL